MSIVVSIIIIADYFGIERRAATAITVRADG